MHFREMLRVRSGRGWKGRSKSGGWNGGVAIIPLLHGKMELRVKSLEGNADREKRRNRGTQQRARVRERGGRKTET